MTFVWTARRKIERNYLGWGSENYDKRIQKKRGTRLSLEWDKGNK
jgi:hypothetical protein